MTLLAKIGSRMAWKAASVTEADPMMPNAHIVHQARGRIRLQVREKCKDPAYFDAIREQLEGLAGIDEVRTNCTTGSIILLHSLENNRELLKRLPQLALFEITDCQQHDASAFTPLRSGLTGIEQLLRNGTAGSVDLKTVAFIGVMGLTLHQIMRGQVLGPALPMLWNAFSLINRMNSEPPDSPSNDAGT